MKSKQYKPPSAEVLAAQREGREQKKRKRWRQEEVKERELEEAKTRGIRWWAVWWLISGIAGIGLVMWLNRQCGWDLVLAAYVVGGVTVTGMFSANLVWKMWTFKSPYQ